MDYSKMKIPHHVGIIIDGNGRWAEEHGKKRSYGHKAGAEKFEKLALHIFNTGVKVLSAYVFSTENFKRSDEEVHNIMELFVKKTKQLTKIYQKKNIKVLFSGRREPLSKEVLKTMDEITEMTKNNTDGILNFCLNYGGHSEIVDATLKVFKDLKENKIIEDDVDEELFGHYLYQDLPPIDFLIRTSGEYRISNFMLWQASYAEFYFPKIYFPDFNEEEFDKAILEYTKRDRRFGGIDYEKKNS
ncbi:MAG: di-trans,poly-cis-decaprenylcistransferase [Bacilli bacterium]|nr:di-trans,poly-cis-decaprenylcistransferase [Bacilli bacterium]